MSSDSRSSVDPLQALTRRRRALRFGGAAVLVLAALWAFVGAGPDLDPDDAPTAREASIAGTEVEPPPLDPAAFDVELWYVEPLEEPAETEAVAESGTVRLTVQLVGIVQEGAKQKAAVYDPVADRLVVLARGETIQGHVLSQITPDSIRLTRGRRVQTLQLAQR